MHTGRDVLRKNLTDCLDYLWLIEAEMVCPDEYFGPCAGQPGTRDGNNTVGRSVGGRIVEGRDDRVERGAREARTRSSFARSG